jgi:hypothetical protein
LKVTSIDSQRIYSTTYGASREAPRALLKSSCAVLSRAPLLGRVAKVVLHVSPFDRKLTWGSIGCRRSFFQSRSVPDPKYRHTPPARPTSRATNAHFSAVRMAFRCKSSTCAVAESCEAYLGVAERCRRTALQQPAKHRLREGGPAADGPPRAPDDRRRTTPRPVARP